MEPFSDSIDKKVESITGSLASKVDSPDLLDSRNNDDCAHVETKPGNDNYKRILRLFFGSLVFNVVAIAFLIFFGTLLSSNSNNGDEGLSKLFYYTKS